MKATNLKVNRLANTVGISSGRVTLSWLPEGDTVQSGFIIKLKVNSKDYFDSGKIISAEYSFPPPINVPSRSYVEWSVTLIDENGALGEEALSAFITIPEKNEWSAKWIDPELIHPVFSRRADEGAPLNKASYLKKEFTVDKYERAIIYATAHGIYNLYLNGEPIEGYFLAPGSSYYTERLQVQAYDVTALIKQGKNELTATVGEGWWRGSTGWHMYRYCYGTSLALLCQLEIDGITTVITDESWQASQSGPLEENDTMRGEKYNAQNVITDWHPVSIEDFGYNNLISSELPVTPHERFPAKLIATPNGQKVLDFGQNFAGYVEFELEANGGETIRLTHGEVLDADGNFQNDNFQNKETPLCRQIIDYTCKKGKNKYHQTKCYFGLRYALIETDLNINGSEFTGVATYSDMKQTGFFECGIPEVNRLFENVLFSMKSNFVDVPTDCPHREKLGFTGDAQVFSETALYLMDSYPVLRRWMRELISCQCVDGCLLYVAPPQGGPQQGPLGMDGSAGWCNAVTIVPEKMLKFTNTPEEIREFYPAIQKWIKFNLDRTKDKRPENETLPENIKEYLLDTGKHWGEWAEPGKMGKDYFAERDRNGHAEIATAFLALDAMLAAEFATLFGYADDAEKYKTIFERTAESYRYVFTDNGKISSERQCHYVRPVAHNILSDNDKKQAINDLVALIKKNGTSINTGFLTTCHLCNVLTDYGHVSVAYDLLLNRKQPSWLYEVDHGATTIWEHWFAIMPDGERRSSHNHYAFGAVAGWLMSRVLGITVSGGNILLRPYPDKRLGYAKGSFLSEHGEIISEWRYKDTELQFKFTVPCGMTANVILPTGEEYTVDNGTHLFTVSI